MDRDADQFPPLTGVLREEMGISAYLENCRWFKQEPKDWKGVHDLDQRRWESMGAVQYYRAIEIIKAHWRANAV